MKVLNFFIFLLAVLIFTSCKGRVSSNELTYWSSNNPEEAEFAKKSIARWNASHPGQPIHSQPIPEGQSSEETILAAVVGQTTPDIYANIWQGAVEDYARAGVLVPFDTLNGFMEFISERCDRSVIQEVTSSDGHIYQIPWKINPIMMMYNPRLFKAAGIDSIPATYSEFITAAKKIKADRNGDGYVDRWIGSTEVSVIWWQRLFNFYPLYLAASGGKPLVKDGKAVFDNKYAVGVFAFLQELYRNDYFPKEQMKGQSDPFLGERIALKFTGPWAIAQVNIFKPEGFDYDFHPMPVPADREGPIYTYGDPKNIVIFNTCQNPEEAWQFLKTLISEEGDYEFLELSGQLPRRKDLLTNSRFRAFFESHPKLKPFAEQAKYVRGMDNSTNLKEVLDLISQEYEASVVYGKKSPEQAVKDDAHAVNLLFLK